MEWQDIKLVDEDTDLSNIHPFDWDVQINGIPYYVCRIEGCCHSLVFHNGVESREELWCYPRHEKPSVDNLVEYRMDSPVAWGLHYDEIHHFSHKHGETEARTGARTIITRNESPFYVVYGDAQFSIPKALHLISKINEHPLEFNSIDFDKKMVGRKIWYNGQPAIIKSFVSGQCCVIIAPDNAEKFKNPPEFVKEDGEYYYEDTMKIDCLESGRVWWFR